MKWLKAWIVGFFQEDQSWFLVESKDKKRLNYKNEKIYKRVATKMVEKIPNR